MGLIKITTGLAMTALFTIAIIGFMIGYANDNNANINIADDSDISSLNSASKSATTNFYISANTSADIFQKSNIETGDNVEGGGQFKTGPSDVLNTAKNILGIADKKLFGDDSTFGIFITTIVAFLVFMIALYGWKAWKGGDVD